MYKRTSIILIKPQPNQVVLAELKAELRYLIYDDCIWAEKKILGWQIESFLSGALSVVHGFLLDALVSSQSPRARKWSNLVTNLATSVLVFVCLHVSAL